MKKVFIGALSLIAALVITGCKNNNDQSKKIVKEQQTEEVVKENRMLIIVDPQVDFTTGSLATAKGPEAMDRLAKAIENDVLDKYNWVIVTQDAHPRNHCSFVENGGVFPPHCVEGTEGMEVYPALQKALDAKMDKLSGGVHYMTKGDLADKEEFSIFQNEHSGEKLTKTITEFEKFDGIDICGIATDYCVYETVKDLTAIYPAKQIRIVTNCIAAVDDNDTKLADLMKENGIEGITF
ncbi:MAG: isochorismatase family protein [Bacteroidales bacterium]|nr:isochorismatase family protein [Bacteroidales bacterium]